MEHNPRRRSRLVAIIGGLIVFAVFLHVMAALISYPEIRGEARAQSPEASERAAQSAADTEGRGAAQFASDGQIADTIGNDLQSSSRSMVANLIGERRRSLSRKEAELRAKEALLQARERDIERRLAELQSEEQVVQEQSSAAAAETPELEKMVNVYAVMKPKDAARIFNSMEEQSVLMIASRLDGRKLAPILAAMDEKTAQRITSRLIGGEQAGQQQDNAFSGVSGAGNIPELLPVR